MQSEGDDIRSFIDVRIGEREIKALLDTGSTMTCVREVDELNWVYGCGAQVRPAPRNSAAVADGSMMSVQSLITLPLVLRPVVCKTLVLSLDHLILLFLCFHELSLYCFFLFDRLYDECHAPKAPTDTPEVISRSNK